MPTHAANGSDPTYRMKAQPGLLLIVGSNRLLVHPRGSQQWRFTAFHQDGDMHCQRHHDVQYMYVCWQVLK